MFFTEEGGEKTSQSLLCLACSSEIISYLGKTQIMEKLQVGLHIMARALVGQSVRVQAIHREHSPNGVMRIKGKDNLQGYD